MISGIREKSKSAGIEIIPVFPSIEGFFSIIGRPCFSCLREGLKSSKSGEYLGFLKSITEDFKEEFTGVLGYRKSAGNGM